MAELFSPVWNIQREEITDLNMYKSGAIPDFTKCIKLEPAGEFTGSLAEVKQHVNELIQKEPLKLRYSIPPSVKYFYKLK